MTTNTFRGQPGAALIAIGVQIVVAWLVGSATDSWKLGVAAGLALMLLTDWKNL